MKKLSVLCLILCLLLQVLPMSALAEDEPAEETTVPEETIAEEQGPAIAPQGQIPEVTGPTASITYGCSSMDAQVPLGGSEQMLKSAKGAVLYELNSGTLLYAYQPDERVEPASLAKILTALIVLEEENLDRAVTVSQSALNTIPPYSVVVGLIAGETMTVKDLLYGAMVGSGNDACAVLAEAVSGSQEAFAERMNQRAREIGCTDSNFCNAHGLPDENQYTTARDMGRILEEALKNEQFREVFGATSYTIGETEKSESRYLITSNYFMSKESNVTKFFDARVTGGRTGSISTENRSMACTAESGDLNLMSIVLGAEGVLESDGYSFAYTGNFEEAMNLLDWGFRYFSVNQILNSSVSVAQFPVSGGTDQIVARPGESMASAVPYGTTADYLTWHYQLDEAELTAPVEENQKIGTAQVWFGSICLVQADLIAMNGSAVSVKEDASQQSYGKPETDTSGLAIFFQGLGIVFGAIVVILIILIGIRFIRGALIRNRRRRRKHGRNGNHHRKG